jgi:hypothetical protein
MLASGAGYEKASSLFSSSAAQRPQKLIDTVHLTGSLPTADLKLQMIKFREFIPIWREPEPSLAKTAADLARTAARQTTLCDERCYCCCYCCCCRCCCSNRAAQQECCTPGRETSKKARKEAPAVW